MEEEVMEIGRSLSSKLIINGARVAVTALGEPILDVSNEFIC
jgi:hypothetical protein